jgi:hypothetical protein
MATGESGGVLTGADKVREFAKNLSKVLLAIAGLVILWLIATGASLYFAVREVNGTYAQGLAINLLSSLLLLALAPVLLSLSALKRWLFWVLVAGAVGVLFAAYKADGGLRDFLLNAGSGLCLLLGIDYYIAHRFETWVDKLGQKAQAFADEPSFLVL